MEPVHDLKNGFSFQVREGLNVFLRTILPNDRSRITGAFVALSEESRYYRFFRGRSRLTEKELQYFTEVDQVNHVAWGAFDTETTEMQCLGIGRFIRYQNDATAAEFAVTVLDAYQHQGLGTVLLAVLFLRAEAVGINRLRACVLPENLVTIRWLQGLGAEAIGKQEYLELELRTGHEDRAKTTAPSQEKFDRLVAAIRRAALAALLDKHRD